MDGAGGNGGGGGACVEVIGVGGGGKFEREKLGGSVFGLVGSLVSGLHCEVAGEPPLSVLGYW